MAQLAPQLAQHRARRDHFGRETLGKRLEQLSLTTIVRLFTEIRETSIVGRGLLNLTFQLRSIRKQFFDFRKKLLRL